MARYICVWTDSGAISFDLTKLNFVEIKEHSDSAAGLVFVRLCFVDGTQWSVSCTMDEAMHLHRSFCDEDEHSRFVERMIEARRLLQ